jgi:hypothetical protein
MLQGWEGRRRTRITLHRELCHRRPSLSGVLVKSDLKILDRSGAVSALAGAPRSVTNDLLLEVQHTQLSPEDGVEGDRRTKGNRTPAMMIEEMK